MTSKHAVNNTQHIGQDEIPKLKLSLEEGGEILSLVDSAASLSLMRADKVPREAIISKTEEHQLLLAGTGATMEIVGKALVKGFVQGQRFEKTFGVVPDLREEAILGIDWLQDEQAVVDFRRGCVHYGQAERGTAYFHRRAPKQQQADVRMTFDSEVPKKTREALQQSTQQFQHVFTTSTTPCKTATHTINLTSAVPFRVRPYRYSDRVKQEIHRQVEEMLAQDVIEPSHSPYSSPVVMVKKKDGKERFCVDYRQLNAITQDEASHLPMIHETLKDLGPAKIFSSLDLKSGYWQVPLDPSSKQLTAFSIPDGGSYQFKVMPFGLKGAPGTFQRLMSEEVLIGYIRQFCLVYLDDVIIYSQSWEDHVRHLHLVLERFSQHGLQLSPEKCRIGRTSVEYLGHVVTATGNGPQQCDLQGIQTASTPRTRRDLRKFLGLCNWLREYIEDFTKLALPMTDLLNTKVAFKWNQEAQAAFDEIKKRLKKPVYLHRPDFTQPFVLQTDASGYGLAAVLYQPQENGDRRVISYASTKMSPTEKRYHSNEQEALAAVWAIRRYRPYLEDRPFTLRTDNRALTWLHSAKDQRAKLTRWAVLLTEFNFTIEHCPGRENELPDALSRDPEDNALDMEMCEDTDRMCHVQQEHHAPQVCQVEVATLFDTIKQGQKQDPQCIHVRQKLRQGDSSLRDQKNYIEEDEALWRIVSPEEKRLVVPQHLITHVLQAYHEDPHAGHPGSYETHRDIARIYFWNK